MQPTRTIPYRFSYGVCVIYVLLDERTLLQSFLPARFAQDGFVWLTDGEGKLLAASDDAVENTLQGHAECSEQRYKGKQHLVIQATCDGSPLQILCGLPTQSFVQGFAGQLQLMGLYLVFALGVGVLLAMILAHQQTWPLRSVVRELISLGFDVRDARQTYEHMKNSLYAMQRKEQNFSTQLVQYRTQLQEMTLERLLISGEIGDTLSTASRTFLDALPASYLIGYGCMVVAGEGGQTPLSDSLRMLFEEQLRHGLAEGAYLHSMGQSFFALILPCRKPEEQAQAVEQVRNQLCMLMQKLPVRVTLGISACEKGVECMHAAYEQARLVYTLGNGREGALVATDVLRDDVPNVDMQNLMQLYRALAAGDEALARQQVHLLYGNPVLLSQGLEQAYHTIRSVLYWAYMSTLPQTTTLDWPAPGASCAPEVLEEQLCDVSAQICEAVNGRKKSHNITLRDQLLSYMEEHFKDPGLYGGQVAAQFNLSEKYLYSFFREQTGTTLGDYLQTLRLQCAADLLRNSDKSINDIYALVGFNSHNTFYKAFRRMYGVAPSQYRQ